MEGASLPPLCLVPLECCFCWRPWMPLTRATQASYDTELVRPTASGSDGKRKLVLAAVAGSAMLLAAAGYMGGGEQRSTGLIQRGTIVAAEAPDAKSRAAAMHAQIMAVAAHDNNDRAGLKSALKSAVSTEAKGKSSNRGYSANAKEVAKRESDAEKERATEMVPWVHWPGHKNTGGGDKFKTARKQSLLEMPMLAVDKSAQVMPLKELMQRETVDHLLHKGAVSDYQLAEADQKGHGQEDARKSGGGGVDCSPFC